MPKTPTKKEVASALEALLDFYTLPCTAYDEKHGKKEEDLIREACRILSFSEKETEARVEMATG